MKNKIYSFLFILSVLYLSNAKAQVIDTFKYNCVDNVNYTSFFTKKLLIKNIYIFTTYTGLSDKTNLSSWIDTFIIDNSSWKRYFKGKIIPFLSKKKFYKKSNTLEFIDNEFYFDLYKKYVPLKTVKVRGKSFYLYRVIPMSGKGRDESLGTSDEVIAFDFKVGIIYKYSLQRKEILMGYESYLNYFKW